MKLAAAVNKAERVGSDHLQQISYHRTYQDIATKLNTSVFM